MPSDFYGFRFLANTFKIHFVQKYCKFKYFKRLNPAVNKFGNDWFLYVKLTLNKTYEASI